MLQYLIPFLAYVAIEPIINYFFGTAFIGYALKTIVTAILVIYYFKRYKEIKKFKLDFPAVGLGILIFIIWISLEGLYPRFGSPTIVNPFEFGSQLFLLILIIKLTGMILVAPLIEELFVRSFLMRIFINADYEKVPIGKYTHLSFIITVLFFGFSHSMWLPGIITGVLLNVLLYKTKSIGSCIQAHAAANISLAIYVLATHNWMFW